MKTHLISKNSMTACNRHLHLGTGRTKSLFAVSPKHFAETFKRDASNCCINCVSEYNQIAKRLKEGKQ